MFSHLQQSDPDILALIEAEAVRQRDGLTLIPSENHTSASVLETLSTVLSDKYAEGYPGKRYYSGNQVVDQLETLAQERAKALFKVPYVNVQPYSGSPANLAVYFATCKPGETSMGLNLLDGGHLTHGWKSSATSHFWKSAPYFMSSKGEIDFDRLRKDALEYKPTLIWCGGTAMPRTVPFAKFAEIADEVGAYLVADVAHIAGLIAGGAHESPIPYAHIVTTTTHKTLRGPRGAMIMVTEKGLAKDPELGDKIDSAIIPGLQGGPHMNTIAGIAVALKEAAEPAFQDYARRVVENAKALADRLLEHGFTLVSGGTDNHLVLVDLTPQGAGRGMFLHLGLEAIGLYANRNMVPGDQSSPFFPSGLRLGSPAATSRGMGVKEMHQIADFIKRVSDHILAIPFPMDKEERKVAMKEFRKTLKTDAFYAEMRQEVKEMCEAFSLPGLK
jgi:glycine hydroxymethyltransferase